jgi:uncharacterized membrane protein
MANVTKRQETESDNKTMEQARADFKEETGTDDVYRYLHQTSDNEEADVEKETKPHDIQETSRKKSKSVLTTPRPWVGNAFADRESAERAYEMLLERGYEPNEINLLMSEATKKRYFPDEEASTELEQKAHEGIAKTALEGAGKGTLIGTLLAFGSNMVLPGVGLFIGGPLFIGLGALAGGLGSALVESGFTEEQAKLYEEDIQQGRIVLGVVPHTDEDAQYFARAWK